MDIARPHLQRLIIALIADTIGTARSRAVDPAEWSRWDAETTIDEDGVGIDSLGRLDAVARVNEFFHLHELGTEDYLVVRRAIGDWVEVVAQTLAMKNDRLTFATSGSSGRPKKIPHRMDRLVDEVDAMTDVLAGEIDQIGLEAAPTRVLAFAPPHHIYGFLFGVLLPSRLGLDVVDGRLAAPSRLRRASAGDLVVATPFIWRKLLDACPRIPNGVIGLSSSAPTPASVWRDASRQGLARLIEIYGSTETAGVGWRRSNRAGFALLPRFRRGAQDGTLVQEGPHGDDVLNAPDMLRWSSARRFRPAGRRDEAEQVGGVNVYPERVREALLAHAWVKECAVRVTSDEAADRRLKAFVVLRGRRDEDAAMAALSRHCAQSLRAPERPASFTFGETLPTNPMGKLADWA